jgi:hypothetical protein
MLRTTDGRVVQKLLDRTARTRGPAHRHDVEHPMAGLTRDLILRGQLTAENLSAGGLHLAVDEMFDRMGRLAQPGIRRQILKLLLADALVGDSR